MKNIKKRILICILIICMLIAPISVYAEQLIATSNTNVETTTEDVVNKEESIEYKPNVTFKYDKDSQKTLENIPEIGCKAAYIVEPVTGKILYEKNAHEKMYPASTTKILTALVVLENCKLTDKAVVSQHALDLVPEGYSNANLQAGEELTISDLLYALLIPSANEAANALAEHVSGSVEKFAELCNNRAKELGCETLHFVNPNGIHDENHYCSAYDLYLIAKECRKYDAFNEIVKTTSYTLPSTDKYSGSRTLKNTNQLLLSGTYYYSYCTGIKTGFTTPAGECLVASTTCDGLDFISVVLGGGTNERFYDTKRLFEFMYDNYSIKEIAKENQFEATIEVGKATKDTATLDVVIDTNISTIVPNDMDINNIPTAISIDDSIVAPIKKNQVVGQATFYVDGLTYKTNLVASHEVEKIPYETYNTIVIIVVVVTISTFVILLIFVKKHRKVVIIVFVVILVIAGVSAYFIIKESSKKSITKATYIPSSNSSSKTNIELDETKTRDAINKELISLEKKHEDNKDGFFAKYYELDRIANGDNVDIYIWAIYGKTNENKEEISSSSMPLKITISLDDYSVVNVDEPPDGTSYIKYFPAVEDQLDGIEFKDKDALCGETYYSK